MLCILVNNMQIYIKYFAQQNKKATFVPHCCISITRYYVKLQIRCHPYLHRQRILLFIYLSLFEYIFFHYQRAFSIVFYDSVRQQAA